MEIHSLYGGEKLRGGVDPVKSVPVRSSALQGGIGLVGYPDTITLLKHGAIRSDDRNNETVDVGSSCMVRVESCRD